MSELNITLATVGGLLLVLGTASGVIKSRLYVSEPLIALAFGVLIGPHVLGMLDPASWGNEDLILEETARITLAITVVGVSLRLPAGYLLRRWRSMVVLLGLLMPLMWLASSLLAYLFLGSISIVVALLIGAIVTPTDPVISTAVATGGLAEENVPSRLRHALSMESAANDGLAYLLVFLPILLLNRPMGEAFSHWFVHTLLWDVMAAVAIGAFLGYLGGHLQKWAVQREITEAPSLLTVAIALALTTLGAVKLIGSDGILAAFAAGVVFSMVTHPEREEHQERTQEAIRRFFDMPVLVLLGMTLPWAGWLDLGWSALVLPVAVLLFRRLPAMLVLSPLVAQVRKGEDTLFYGWFGPMGIASLYYATLALRETGAEEAWVAGSLVVCASVLAYGVTATPFTKLYGRRARSSCE